MLGKRGLGPTRHVGRWKSGRALVALVFMALPLLLSRPALAGSATVYSTMNYTEWQGVGGSSVVAQAFTTSATPGTLTSVAAWLRNNAGSTGTYTVTLNASAGGQPAAVLSTLASSVSVVPYYDGTPVITPGTAPALSPNTTYFIEISGSSGMVWKGGTSAPTTSVTPTPSFTSFASSDSGATWGSLTGVYRDATIVVNEQATVPDAPAIGTATAGNTTASVAWTAPASNGSAILDYTVTSSPDSITCTAASSPCVVQGLTNGRAYTFTVTARNSIGSSVPSTATAVTTPRTVPGAPTGVSAVAGDGTAALSWVAPISDGGSSILSYTVTSTPASSPCSAAATTCTVSGLSNGTAYTFTVHATNVAGNSAESVPSSSVTPRSSGGGGGGTPPPPTPTDSPSPSASPSASPSVTMTSSPTVVPAASSTASSAQVIPHASSGSPSPSRPAASPTAPVTAIASPATPSTAPTPAATLTPTAGVSAAPTRSATASHGSLLSGTSLFRQDAPAGPAMNLSVSLHVGGVITDKAVSVSAAGLKPGSTVQIQVYSAEQVIGSATADGSGSAVIAATMPSDLPPGTHTIMAVGTGPDGQPVQSVGGFDLASDGTITALAPPGQVAHPIRPGSDELQRAIAAGKPLYSVALYPAVVATVAVAGVAVVGLAGAGGLVNNSAGRTSHSSSRGKLAGVVTKKLKALKPHADGIGDRSRTWALPLTAAMDRWIAKVPRHVGKYSALASRLLVDGSWARAMFGSAAFILWVAGVVLGLFSSASVHFQALPPTLPVMLAIIVLGILDAAAGATAWIVIAVAAVLTGHVTTLADVRTLLGLFVVCASIPLLAHAIRPLRRPVASSRMDRWDQVADYVMPPVFLAFAAASMFKALNGLSGLELVSKKELIWIQLVVAVAFLIRRGAEDMATYLYPSRSAQVQPEKLTSPGVGMSWISVAVRVIVFVMIAVPFFGFGWVTLAAALLTAIPMALKIYEDQLPNWLWLNKWYPRGVFRFALLLVLGVYISTWLLGHHASDAQIRQTYNLLLLPGIVAALIELIGRQGWEWPDTWAKRYAGVCIWAFAVCLVTGVVSLG